MISEDLKLHLPQYLGELEQRRLLEQLGDFQEHREKIYSDELLNEDEIHQGDALGDLFLFNLPDVETKEGPAVVVSNSCDVNSENRRFVPSRLLYSPLIDFNKLTAFLIEKFENQKNAVDSYLKAIQNQTVSNVLFFPQGEFNSFEGPKVVFLDNIISVKLDSLELKSVNTRRLFALNNLGFYLFVFKLSVHFTRIRENVNRG